MTLRRTEQPHDLAQGLDTLAPPAILSALVEGQLAALAALRPALPALQAGAEAMAAAIGNGGRLIYTAAGSSGLMGMADGLELPGTFGLSPAQIVISLAGGAASLQHMTGNTEDDVAEARAAASTVRAHDCVIAISASGATPYPLAFLKAAPQATRIAIVNTPASPMLAQAEIGICLETPPEVISGSTRLGAATAQKAALNAMSSLMGVLLGHVHDGMMVNLVADNAKLEDRAARIVARISGCDLASAHHHLTAASGAIKLAVLLASGARDIENAAQILGAARGHLRAALNSM
ncbi:N-acetylmuramic acid 6-phosphate etherase [Abyssibius alkaniclasticus]|uniref:N-acetylmuramic acid 6-phosphate etherase n=1 Tax=Abyssibius alkaniclasticus TaxID=2881234 RepID=UPI0023648AB0|nr:N-acetylmuramic acid 6-phosphate etherase [Abyssibius alkaniclasticus]UPH71793.1 N-acetylmuramic acid 6-phosphate etherase [Abyssibius alkaniclasticus]